MITKNLWSIKSKIEKLLVFFNDDLYNSFKKGPRKNNTNVNIAKLLALILYLPVD